MSSGQAGTQEFSEARKLFEDRFASETLSSERRRVFILAAVFGSLLLLAVMVPLITGKTPFTRTIFLHGLEVRTWFLGLMASAAAYEAIMWIYLRHATRSGKGWGTIARYMNALVEISIPSAVIVLMASVYRN